MNSTSSFSRQKQIGGLLGWLLLCFMTSAIGGLASISAGSFYGELVRPTWSPPGWLFGPVWTVLYLCMAIAAWLVWRSRSTEPATVPSKSAALWLFVTQLAVNGLWSWLFFVWRLGGAAFADIVLMWLLIAGTIFVFWRFSRAAALLLVPYWLWVTFAAALNWTLWQTNPALLL